MKVVNDAKKRFRGGLLLFSLVLLWVGSGCSYHLVGSQDNIAPEIQRVFVDMFVNRTSEAGLENLFRNAFSDQILRGGRFQLAGSREEADAIIRGDIQRLTTSHLAYQTTDIAAEERVTVVLDIIFEERVSKKVIWQSRKFSYNGDYIVASGSGNVSATEAGRKTALTKLSNDTAEKAYSLMLSRF